MIHHIERIVLTVTDVDRAIDFYERVLLMTATTQSQQTFMMFGEQSIQFERLGDEMRHHALEGSASFALVSEWSMEQLLQHLRSQQVAILEGPVTTQTAHGSEQFVYVNDPDNNLIKLITRA